MKRFYPYWGLLVLVGLMSISALAQESTPEPASATTSEASITEEVILPTVISVTVEPSATPSATAITPEVTLAPATLTPATSTPLPTLDATLLVPAGTVAAVVSSPTATMATSYIVGRAIYQHSRLNQQGILIEIFSAERSLLSSAITDENGIYQIATPANLPYWLVASAQRHQQVALVVQPNALPPEIILPGGDLDADGCITTTDMDMLLAALPEATISTEAQAAPTSVEATPSVTINTSDINHDGKIDIADFAILAGNVKATCEIFVRATEAPPVTIPEVTITTTAILPTPSTLETLSVLPTLIATATPLVITSEPLLAATLTPEVIQPSPVPASLTPVIEIPLVTAMPTATGLILSEEVKHE